MPYGINKQWHVYSSIWVITDWWEESLEAQREWLRITYSHSGGFPGGSDSKESTCNAGDPGSIPASRRSLGEGNSNPLQYSCLENPTDRGAWQATVHGVANGYGYDWATSTSTVILKWTRKALSQVVVSFPQRQGKGCHKDFQGKSKKCGDWIR